MAIERTKEGFWVVVGDTLRTPWVKEKGILSVDHLIKPICSYIKPGDTVIDVGANIGDHTISYLETVTSMGRVIAFEPDEDCHACCVLNCGTFLDMYRAAATDVRRRVGLHTVSNRGENFLNLEEGSIEGFPIDALHLQQCNLIKIDVEGAELLVLKGSIETIIRCKPIIICELVDSQLERFSTSVDQLLNTLNLLGYTGRPLLEGENRDWIFEYTRILT